MVTHAAAEATLGSVLLHSLPLDLVAERLGCSRRLLSRWRAGAGKPSATWRTRLAAELGIDRDAWDRPLASATTIAAIVGRRLAGAAERIAPPNTSDAPALLT